MRYCLTICNSKFAPRRAAGETFSRPVPSAEVGIFSPLWHTLYLASVRAEAEAASFLVKTPSPR